MVSSSPHSHTAQTLRQHRRHYGRPAGPKKRRHSQAEQKLPPHARVRHNSVVLSHPVVMGSRSPVGWSPWTECPASQQGPQSRSGGRQCVWSQGSPGVCVRMCVCLCVLCVSVCMCVCVSVCVCANDQNTGALSTHRFLNNNFTIQRCTFKWHFGKRTHTHTHARTHAHTRMHANMQIRAHTLPAGPSHTAPTEKACFPASPADHPGCRPPRRW